MINTAIFPNELEKLGQTWPLCDLLKRGSWFSWACSAHPFLECLEVRLCFLLFRMYQCVREKLNSGHSVSTAPKGTSWGRQVVLTVSFFSCFSIREKMLCCPVFCQFCISLLLVIDFYYFPYFSRVRGYKVEIYYKVLNVSEYSIWRQWCSRWNL